MSWEVGDMAVCVDNTAIRCVSSVNHTGRACPPLKSVNRVTSVQIGDDAVDPKCSCVILGLNGYVGLASRFRKVDKLEPCEQEFVTLLKRSKTAQPKKIEAV